MKVEEIVSQIKYIEYAARAVGSKIYIVEDKFDSKA